MTSNCRANWNNFSSLLSARVYCSSKIYISCSWNHSCVFFFLSSLFSPFVESVAVATPTSLPSLAALLLLVPLVAAIVCVLLWRQKHISDRGESSGVFFLDSFSCSVHLRACRLPLKDVGHDNLWGCCNESAPSFPPVSFEWECVSMLPDTHFADISPLVLRY